jgi:predicted PurR-regulated permease PerM
VVIFVVVAFWRRIRGIPGPLMAVPFLIAFKVLCNHVDLLAVVGEPLSGRRPVA